jgi:hypothetical protein
MTCRLLLIAIALAFGCGRPIPLGSIGSISVPDGGADLGSGGSCATTVLASATFPAQYGALTVDDSNVYWVEGDNSATPTPGQWIMSIAKSGGTPTRIGAAGDVPMALAVDAGNIYIADYGIGFLHGAVDKLPKASGSTLGSLVSGQEVSGLALNAAGIYFVGFTGQATSSYALQYLPSGGALTPLATGDSGPSQGGALALDAQNIYWVTSTTLHKVPIANPSGAVSLASGALDADVQTLVVDGSNAYYVDGSSLMKVAHGGGTPSKLADVHLPVTLAVSSVGLYWRDGPTRSPGDPGPLNRDGAISLLPLGSATAQTLTSGLYQSGLIAVDASGVYFVDNGKLNRLCAAPAAASCSARGAACQARADCCNPNDVCGSGDGLSYTHCMSSTI